MRRARAEAGGIARYHAAQSAINNAALPVRAAGPRREAGSRHKKRAGTSPRPWRALRREKLPAQPDLREQANAGVIRAEEGVDLVARHEVGGPHHDLGVGVVLQLPPPVDFLPELVLA